MIHGPRFKTRAARMRVAVAEGRMAAPPVEDTQAEAIRAAGTLVEDIQGAATRGVEAGQATADGERRQTKGWSKSSARRVL